MRLSSAEYKAFIKWAKTYYMGTGYPIPDNVSGIQNSPAYSIWVKQGKVGYQSPPPPPNVLTFEGKQYQWSPVTQGGATTATPVTPVAPTAPPTTPSEDEELRQLAGLELERFDWQKKRDIGNWVQNQQALEQARTAEANRIWLTQFNAQQMQRQQTWDIAQQRFAAKDMGLQNLNTELQRQIDEMQFERDRERMLSGLPSNDWITRYTLQNQPNPYQKPEVSPIDQLESNLDMATGTVQKWEAEAVNAANAEAAGERYHITSAEALDTAKQAQTARDAMYATYKTVQEESIGWSPQPVPKPYPDAPSWLPQYAPGLQAGQMITRQNVPTPSGQQLTAMSQDQLEQLGYFGKWTGQLGGKYPWESLTEAASLMQPRSPGFGRTRWTPQRQF